MVLTSETGKADIKQFSPKQKELVSARHIVSSNMKIGLKIKHDNLNASKLFVV
jgi:hypothetical protein